jgi:methylmalonyl-CoA/ethylmalonyl-CoA epimerase
MAARPTILRQVSQRAVDLDRAVAFYTEVLGLELLVRFDPPGLAFLDLGGPRLLLEGGAPSSVLYLATDDLDATVEALERRDVEILERPQVIHRDDAGDFGPAGHEERMAFFRDSEGNTLAYSEQRAPTTG